MNIEIQPYFAEGERYPALIGVRVEGDEYETAYVSKGELADALDDNAKLRELAKKLVILAFARCADCDLLNASCALVPTQKCLLWNECESIARELGVEVDDG